MLRNYCEFGSEVPICPPSHCLTALPPCFGKDFLRWLSRFDRILPLSTSQELRLTHMFQAAAHTHTTRAHYMRARRTELVVNNLMK